jgi:hypothetical protein
MPAEFSKQGVSFQYPENWSLEEDDAPAGQVAVTVCSPGGAFWTLSVCPGSADPVELAEASVNAMKEDYPDLESEAIEQELAGRRMVGCDMRFWYLDLTSTAGVRCMGTEEATYVVFYQAEDREFDQMRRVFDAMIVSFLDHLDPSGP